ncbi:MAG: hypothetical protein JW941_04140, partial [Candidatus Coatesbacteria bacterium]|nr:hypothetical protein [Candidatus Coatesbacteria bacterium]
TFEFISEIGMFDFTVDGLPFVSITPDDTRYGMGDTIVIDIAAETSAYAVTGDIYMLILDPNGVFWTPCGPGFSWTLGFDPFLPAFTLPAMLDIYYEGFWELPVTFGSIPFGETGQYHLFAGIAEQGTLDPWSDININEITVE